MSTARVRQRSRFAFCLRTVAITVSFAIAAMTFTRLSGTDPSSISEYSSIAILQFLIAAPAMCGLLFPLVDRILGVGRPWDGASIAWAVLGMLQWIVVVALWLTGFDMRHAVIPIIGGALTLIVALVIVAAFSVVLLTRLIYKTRYEVMSRSEFWIAGAIAGAHLFALTYAFFTADALM